jgi:hypothetical protein
MPKYVYTSSQDMSIEHIESSSSKDCNPTVMIKHDEFVYVGSINNISNVYYQLHQYSIFHSVYASTYL